MKPQRGLGGCFIICFSIDMNALRAKNLRAFVFNFISPRRCRWAGLCRAFSPEKNSVELCVSFVELCETFIAEIFEFEILNSEFFRTFAANF